MGEKPDVRAWNYVWYMLTVWMKYMQEEQLPCLDNLYLKRTRNLEELTDKPQARSNLGVYSKDDSDNRYLQLTGGALSGGLKIAGNTAVDITSQGLAIRWNETNGSGATFFVNNRGGGTGGFVFRNVNALGTAETGRVTIQPNGSLVTSATVRGGTLESTGNASVAGTTTTANLTVQNNAATVGGRHVARAVNGNIADENGNVTVTIPSPGVTDVRLGSQGNQGASNSFTVPAGCLVTGLNGFKVTGPDFQLYGLFYRPLQKFLNGVWVTVSVI